MTAFPAAGDYYKAVQVPSRVFTVPKLQAAEFVWDSLGPTLARGSSAVVFQAAVEGVPQALRCYIRNDASSRDRYSALDAYLVGHDLSPYVSGTTWLDSAIRVNQATWPVLTMTWIDGRTLNEYVDFLVAGSNGAALTTLAARWRELVARLQRSEFVHGDLQHGNVMVDQEGQLRLVDFDGVWIPQLAGKTPPSEFGHPNYQHPGVHIWDRWLDTFSALVIYLSLIALGKDPALWLALYSSKNLLFVKNDFFPPFETEAWKQLAALRDPEIDDLVRRLQECCTPEWVSNKSLEMTLDQRSASSVSSIPPAQRWWERPAAGGAGAAGGAAAGGAAAGGAAAGAGAAPAAAAAAAAVGQPAWPRPQDAPPTVQPRPLPDPPGSLPDPPGSLPGPPGSLPGPPVSSPGQAGSPAGPPGSSLPAPPPLSAPLGLAGTGPMPQLRRTMAPPGATVWWTGSGAASPQGPAGSMPSRPTPQAPAPPGRPPQGPPTPGKPATRPQPGPITGGIVLGLGIIFLIAGAASHLPILVVLGLIAGAWGIWRLVTTSGENNKPPGQT